MPYNKQNVFLDENLNDVVDFEDINDLSYTPAIENEQQDSDILLASNTGFGVVNKVAERYWDASKPGFRTRHVNSYELLEVMPANNMRDSDTFLSDSKLEGGINHWIRTTARVTRRTGTEEKSGTFNVIGGGLGTAVNDDVTVPSGGVGVDTKVVLHYAGKTAEGVAIHAFNANDIAVKPTSSLEMWDRIAAVATGFVAANIRVGVFSNSTGHGNKKHLNALGNTVNNRSDLVDVDDKFNV